MQALTPFEIGQVAGAGGAPLDELLSRLDPFDEAHAAAAAAAVAAFQQDRFERLFSVTERPLWPPR